MTGHNITYSRILHEARSVNCTRVLPWPVVRSRRPEELASGPPASSSIRVEAPSGPIAFSRHELAGVRMRVGRGLASSPGDSLWHQVGRFVGVSISLREPVAASDGFPVDGGIRDFTEDGTSLAVCQAETIRTHQECVHLLHRIGGPCDAGDALRREIRVGLMSKPGANRQPNLWRRNP